MTFTIGQCFPFWKGGFAQVEELGPRRVTVLYPYQNRLARMKVNAAKLATWLHENPPLFPSTFNVLGKPILDPPKSRAYG